MSTSLRFMGLPLPIANTSAAKNADLNQQIIKLSKHLHKTGKFSPAAFLLTLSCHAAAIAGAIYLNQSEKVVDVEQQPMMVSLLSAPVIAPETVPLMPTPPKMQPKVESRKVVTHEPTPTPIQQNVLSHEQITPPEPVKQQAEPVEKPVMIAEKAPVIEPAAQPKEEIPELVDGVAYLKQPAVVYPKPARQAREQGLVMIRVLVGATGMPEQVEVAQSSGFERLDDAAVAAVKAARFVPYKRNNLAMSAYVKLPIRFSL